MLLLLLLLLLLTLGCASLLSRVPASCGSSHSLTLGYTRSKSQEWQLNMMMTFLGRPSDHGDMESWMRHVVDGPITRCVRDAAIYLDA